MKISNRAVLLGVSLLSTAVLAQDIRPLMQTRLQGQAPVAFDQQVTEGIGVATSLSNATFKPAGSGPFPAVVIVPSCGGVRQPQVREHAEELLAAGFVVLVQDSNEPRGKTSTCNDRSILSTVGAMDAYAALRQLAAQAYVDKERIFLVGYSWGAFVAQLAASPQSAEVFGSTIRFRAIVANYGNCDAGTFPRLVSDVDRPLLMLMGGADKEAPPASCFPLLENMKTSGVPIEWFVYPGMTHAWDSRNRGAGYVYDEATSKDATKRMVAFFRSTK